MKSLRDEILVRYDDILVPVQVHIWRAEQPRYTAICFHQYFGSAQEFEAFAHALMARGISVIAANCPGRRPSGFYRSEKGYNTAFMLRYMMQICQRYQSLKTVLVGYGLGGTLCMAAVRAGLVRPYAMILQDAPIRNSGVTKKIVDLTGQLATLSHENGYSLGKMLLDAVSQAGFGQFGPRWAAALIEKRGDGHVTILDPELGNSDFPEFDFSSFFKKTNIPIAMFANSGLNLSSYSEIALSDEARNVSLYTFDSQISPGFSVTSEEIIQYLERVKE